MTLDEKIAQLGTVEIKQLVDENNRFSLDRARELLINGIGQITRISGGLEVGPREAARLANDIQRFLIEETRLGIPAIIHEECLSGFMAKTATT
ncbi:MAG TPA: beta-glucosidase, partial [Thermofilum sp.]|nr:beta-glucosidase [Thermofilum sp.]